MAEDRDLLIKQSTLEAIAQSIRSKTGKSDTITPTEMPEEILSIKGNGSGDSPDTSDATATAETILMDYTAYVDGKKVTGTIPTYGGDPSLTVYTVDDNESGGQTYTITSFSYITSETDGEVVYTIGG